MPTLSTPATPTNPVSGGPYVITSAIGTLTSGNYTFSFVVGDLDVTKATLIVTADDQSRIYGDANPSSRPATPASRTASSSTIRDVTGAPSLSTAASSTSPVGGSP